MKVDDVTIPNIIKRMWEIKVPGWAVKLNYALSNKYNGADLNVSV